MPDVPGQQWPDLATLVTELLGKHNPQWLADNALGDDGQPAMTRQTADQIIKGEQGRKGWVASQRLRAMARLFGVQDAPLYIGNAVSQGLAPPRLSPFSLMLDPRVDQLTHAEQAHLHQVITRFIDRGITH